MKNPLNILMFCVFISGPAGAEIGFGPGQSLNVGDLKNEAAALNVPAAGLEPAKRRPSNDYRITGSDLGGTGWDFIQLAGDFQAHVPGDIARDFNEAGRQDLVAGISRSYTDRIRTGAGPERQEVAVEITRLLIEKPYPLFTRVIPPATWGTRLAHYLGGEVAVVEKDRQGRAVRQLERMVLSSIPLTDADIPLINQDMTKAEIIEYRPNGAKVYWRVYRSDNGSTKADIGSVEFSAYGSDSVLVTFHSAHRIAGLDHFPRLAGQLLERTFLDHAKMYRSLVAGSGLR